MQIQEAATRIISQWEHGGRYDCHGDGAYGLIGWQGVQLVHLLEHYNAEGSVGTASPPSDYNPLTAKNEPELNDLATGELMQKVQREQARHYMTSAIRHQQQFYPFKTALAQLVLCDMGVNNGIWNKYVVDALKPGGNDEWSIIMMAMNVREHVVKTAGQWDKYEGIRRRYTWYYEAVKQAPSMSMVDFLPSVMVNGNEVKLCDHREGIQALIPPNQPTAPTA